jgi:protein-disulfide isomerase
MENQPTKSVFDILPPKQAFYVGIISAVFGLGTIGFIVLGGCMLSDGCTGIKTAFAGDDTKTQVAVAPTPTPTPAAPEAKGNPAAVTDKDHIRGNKNAEVTLIEYSDFECPFCGRFHPTMQKIMTEYGEKVRWVYRHFPLSFHPQAEPAAEAAECADEQGKFWEFADKLVENQTSLNAETYKKIAGDLKLNLTKFQSCLDSDKMLAKVRAQAQEGASAGISGTPGTFVIGKNGKMEEIKGAYPFEAVKQAVENVLK